MAQGAGAEEGDRENIQGTDGGWLADGRSHEGFQTSNLSEMVDGGICRDCRKRRWLELTILAYES